MSLQTRPFGPPPSVLDDVALAGEIAGHLAARGRELHFRPGGGRGRVVVELRDLDGNVLGAVAPSVALGVLAGVVELDH